MEPEGHGNDVAAREWSSSIRLASVFSVVAALTAVILAGHVPDTTIVVCIIVVGTVLSWFQLEDQPATVPLRHRRSPRSR